MRLMFAFSSRQACLLRRLRAHPSTCPFGVGIGRSQAMRRALKNGAMPGFDLASSLLSLGSIGSANKCAAFTVS
jgi:hypothetical protein